MKTLQGIAASYGVAIGPAFIYKRSELEINCSSIEDSDAEWARFESARVLAHKQLEAVYQKAELESGAEQAEIFKAQAMMLDDPELIGTVKNAVKEQKINVESALSEAAESFAQMLESLEDEYLTRER